MQIAVDMACYVRARLLAPLRACSALPAGQTISESERHDAMSNSPGGG
jgi:hypothetical protein